VATPEPTRPGRLGPARRSADGLEAAAAPGPARPLRLFVAITLPPTWKQYLAARAQDLERLAPGYARWVAPDLLHLTLVFLGDQPASRLPAIADAVAAAAAGQRAFPLALGAAGAFGAPPRVLWVGARPAGDQLSRLHAALVARLTAGGIPFDAKPLVAHLTVGRARRDAAAGAGRALAAAVPALAMPPPPPLFAVETITLMRSELSSGGPRYTALREFPLGLEPSRRGNDSSPEGERDPPD
jgi:RNA 2',3'-cyclic 3'-phosphodiesterase